MLIEALSTNSEGYRYGFNGKEKDDKGEWGMTQYDFGARIYNPAIGKFLSVDPLTKSFAMLSPYQYASNRPIDGIDLDGMEWIHYKVQFTRKSDGTVIPLEKKVVRDFRKDSEENMNELHGTSDFYTKFSAGFGKKGRGVLFTYEEFDSRGSVISTTDNMEVVSGLTRHGFYAGRGSVTKYGEKVTPPGFGNYDFSLTPINLTDAIAKEHDNLQNIDNYKGYMHADYLNTDVLFVAKLRKLKNEFDSNPHFIDPFTGRAISEEAKSFANNAINLFSIIIALKVTSLQEKLDKGEISQEYFNNKTFLFRNPQAANNAPLPKPSDISKFKD
jgi:RHS repeat-associated protein